MKLTCLGMGMGQATSAGPACHLLKTCGTQLLLECPLDMSVQLLFLPTVLLPPTGKGKRNVDMEGASTFRKFQRTGLDLNRQKSLDIQTDNGQTRSPFRAIEGHVLLDVEPWYKTAEFGLIDVSSLDAVLISNPEGMLGLPFLTSIPQFSGKIYATITTAKIGQLMMEELVTMHAEFIQIFGRSDSASPFWLGPATLAALPLSVKRALVDDDGVGRANWHSLYSKKDVETCMKKVHCLHYDEEVNIYDCLRVKPCSSGLEIGASNWVISGSKCSLSYFSASQFNPGHAMDLSLASHASSDVLFFSDLSTGLDNLGLDVRTDTGMQNTIKVSENRSSDSDSKEARHESQKLPALKFSGSEGPSTEGWVQSPNESAVREVNLCGDSTDQLSSVCKAAVDAVNAGGSVLVTISGVGASLELLEVMSQQFRSSNLGHVPMFFISPAAEETLVFANTVPEWLCAMRQEKLYAGEALFGHVELLQEKRLHRLPALHSPESVNVWREPCVVFAAHWSLRMGPSVCLLCRWRQNPHCLLILTQAHVNFDLALSPFRPISMKIMRCPMAGRLRGGEVVAIMQKLKPKLTLLPETMKCDFQEILEGKAEPLAGSSLFYDKWDVLSIPGPKEVEVDMSADLALQIHPKQLDSGMAVARMTMNLQQKDGRWSLEVPSNSEIHRAALSSIPIDEFCWGRVEMDDLVRALEERGMYCEVKAQTRDEARHRHTRYVVVSSPSPAKVEVRPDGTLVETDDPVVRRLIADAVRSLLHVM